LPLSARKADRCRSPYETFQSSGRTNITKKARAIEAACPCAFLKAQINQLPASPRGLDAKTRLPIDRNLIPDRHNENSCVARPRLDRPKHGARISGSVRFIALDAPEGAPFVKNRPGDAGELVGERDRQNVGVQALLGGFDPGFEPITFQVLYPDQHNPCRLHKQNAQVVIAALAHRVISLRCGI
jgi:hypothetical protein